MLGLERINQSYKAYEQGKITKAQLDDLLKKLLPVRISDIQRKIKNNN